MPYKAIMECSSSSSSLVTRTYDVFVSFRGEDTRNNFTDFLFQALRRKGFHAFKDDADLKKGESIAPELQQAIEGSRIFIVVFSKNYASSTWCLRELAHICYFVAAPGRHILPIFYDVDPSDVRKQSGYFEKPFVELEERFREDNERMEEVQRWREALTQVANLSGWDIRNKPQYAGIEEVVQKVTDILGHKFSSLPNDNLVGMKFRVEELAKLLYSESSNDVRVFGITGMDGIGKTTLVRALFEGISHQYDFTCYIDDVNQIYGDSSTLGVQKQLLSHSLNEKCEEICNVSQGTYLIWKRLQGKKALIVLDNVDEVEQLKIFTGNRDTMLRDCLGRGSIIIIISSDEQILRIHGVDEVHQVQPLKNTEAVQLFCRHAFKANVIMNGFEKMTNEVLWHAQGHPFAIEILGSSLFGLSVSQWRSALAMLRENKSKKIMDLLRISFEALDSTNKQIFLDISCFLHGYEVEHVVEILNFRGFYPEYGLQVLINKSLLIVEDGRIKMHRLLMDLGQSIVREISPKEPRNWSRVWSYKDLQTILSNNMPAENLESVVCEFALFKTTLSADGFSNMRHLKLLRLNYVEFSGSLDYLPSELGYLCWHGYPFKSLPPRFLPYKLVSLSLANSKIKQLWEDTKPLHNLKRLDLSSSEDLIKVPDLGEAINLEWLSLKSCTKIREIHPSIGLLRKLSYVTLEGCKSLIKLPHFEETQNLEILDLERCIKLEKIHPSIGLIRKLKFLNLKNCESLTMLPHFREDLNLEILNLEGCRKLGQINPSIHHLKKLTVLNLKGCKRLVSLPNSILCLNSLSYLNLSACSNLSYIQLLEKPRDEGHSKRPCIGEASVRSSIMKRLFKSPLHLFNSRTHKNSFSHLLPSPNFSCIRELDLSFCALLQIPDVIGNLHSLERLNLSGNSFCKLPNLKELSKLYRLVLRHCRQLKYLPELPSQTYLPSVIYERPWPTTESPVWANAPQKPLLHVTNSGLEVLNCPELVEIERERCTRMTVSWMIQILQAQRRIDPLSIPMNPLFSSVIPGSEIPRLFNHQEYSTLTRIDESPFGHDYVAAVFCVIFEARFKRGIVSSICPPKAKGKFSDSKISMVFDSDLAIADYVSDYLWIFFLNKYEFIKYRYTPLYDEIVDLVGNDHYDIDVKKCGYRLIYDLDLELSNLAMMHGGNSPALNNDLSAIEDNK